MIEEIRKAVSDASEDKRKIAMFHYQVLINSNKLKKHDPVEFCTQVGVKESFATEFKKMLALAEVIKSQGASINLKLL